MYRALNTVVWSWIRYQVTIHWVVALCGLVRRYQRLSRICFLHLQGIHPGSSKMLVCAQTTEHDMIPAGGVRVCRSAGSVGCSATTHWPETTSISVASCERVHFANVFKTVVTLNIAVGVTFIKVHLRYQSHTTHFCDMATKSLTPSATECTFTHYIHFRVFLM